MNAYGVTENEKTGTEVRAWCFKTPVSHYSGQCLFMGISGSGNDLVSIFGKKLGSKF